jgi:hypothetical protein
MLPHPSAVPDASVRGSDGAATKGTISAERRGGKIECSFRGVRRRAAANADRGHDGD